MEPRPRGVGVYEVRDRRRIVIEKPESVQQYEQKSLIYER